MEDNAVESEDTKETIPHEEPIHDAGAGKEGVFAWLQVLAAFFFLNLNTWGMMNTYGVFQTYYELDLLRYQTSSNISWIGSTQAFLLFLVSIIAGPIFDLGHLRSLLCMGSILLVAGMFLLSITTQYWQVILTQALMMGLGFGCLYLPAPAVVSQYFDASTALAVGASSAGSALGGVVYPIAFTQLQSRWATRVLGFILLATSIIPLLVMKSRVVPTTTRGIIDRKAFRDMPYLLLNLGLFFGFMGLYIVFYYIQLYALDRTNVSPSLAEYMLVIINASSLPGRLIPGYYADKIGSINMQIIMALISTILTFCLMAIRTEPALVAFCVLYGFAAGAFMGLPAAGVVSLSLDKSKIGTRLGMTLGFVGFGVLISNPIAGAILGKGNNWTGLIVWCGALLAASSISMAASRVVKVGPGPFKII
ncbi:MFS general substrate transporter [Biscogniauxia mediterranea]|nr:MFS general substrate transporter [Biscogniauxia mediterranea]